MVANRRGVLEDAGAVVVEQKRGDPFDCAIALHVVMLLHSSQR